MFVPVWLLALAALVFLAVLRLAFARRGGDMIERQRQDAPPIPAADEAALLARPEVAAPLAAGRKIEAIREVRRLSGLGLKEAKELVERSGTIG
jgi:ribosomal protein L7/L12